MVASVCTVCPFDFWAGGLSYFGLFIWLKYLFIVDPAGFGIWDAILIVRYTLYQKVLGLVCLVFKKSGL
ncbi:hypothetical protein AS219_01995 [Neorickettsia sp. 179522]|nr:hypothetical protein AS219_01995 [Neorickettsia sp. 179522]